MGMYFWIHDSGNGRYAVMQSDSPPFDGSGHLYVKAGESVGLYFDYFGRPMLRIN